MRFGRFSTLMSVGVLGFGLIIALMLGLHFHRGAPNVSAVGPWVDAYAAHLDGVIAPGGEFKRVTEVYRRHGPADGLMRTSDDYVPESSTETQRLIFGADGSLDGYRFEVSDSLGQTLRLISFDGGDDEARIVNLPNETSQVVPRPQGASDVAGIKKTQLDGHRRLLNDLIENPTRDSTILKEGSRIFISFPTEVPEVRDEYGTPLEGGYTIPYVRDLDPVEAYISYEIDSSSTTVLAVRVFVVDERGVETLVESREKVLETFSAGESGR